MKYFITVLAVLVSLQSLAQQKPTEMDKSPMDVSYCPANFPILKMNGKVKDKEEPIARVLYSRPQKNGRPIFGGIVRYGDVWRMGANEATEIDIFKPVKIGNKILPKGRYTMYAVTSENKWTIIFNADRDIWGLAHTERKDILKIDVPVEQTAEVVEAFTIYFEPMKGGSKMMILWDNCRAGVPMYY
ncbi:MAG TPA: hypothetical protein DCL43_14285 [Chitinophagaceae bacterium]|nr:hypothetical protein [Chitinophagaceae bacterium]HAN37268.1 hypothetical protein [Chitinophagaceae bacterium]